MVLSKVSRKWPLFLLLSLIIIAVPFIFLSIKGAKADASTTAIANLQRYAGNVINAHTGPTNQIQSKTVSGASGAATVPVNTIWYFAEGRAGKGFREYFTIENPSSTACSTTIQYNYTPDNGSLANKTVTVIVKPLSRLTESVNLDLGFPDASGAAANVAAVISVNQSATPNCSGVVAERPIYFTNFHGISSGTDVLGATHLSKAYIFADIASQQNGQSYLTILNPNKVQTTVTVGYYAVGRIIATQTLTVLANARGTIFPGAINLPNHVAALVAADQPVVVERPFYFTDIAAGSATVPGAYDVVGATSAGADWLFAEGYTGPTTKEYLTLANLNPNGMSSNLTITLKSKTGATQSYMLSLAAQTELIWDVNAHNNFSGASPEVSAEVVVNQGAFVTTERQMFFSYQHTMTNGQYISATGGTDVVGQAGPAAYSAYTFAEGYANMGYNAWLTLQNPTANPESINVTLINGLGQSYTQTVSVPANARYTEDLASLVQTAFHAGTDNNANAFSTTVQSTNGAVFVAERPTYFNTNSVSSFAAQGGADIIGYVGG